MDRVVDKRLIERTGRRLGEAAPAAPSARKMPDLKDRVRALDEEEVERFREELVSEGSDRRERIERQLAEDKSAVKQIEFPVVPIPESEI